MDLVRAIRILALKAILKPDFDYHLRSIQRWYSRTFHTPLAQVQDLSLEELLRAYYEEKYGEWKEDDLEAERQDLILTDAQVMAQTRAQDAEDADAIEFARVVEQEEQEKALTARAEARGNIVDTKDPGLIVNDSLGTGRPIAKGSTIPVPNLKDLPPEIEMEFVDQQKFEQELEGFGTMTQPDHSNLPKK